MEIVIVRETYKTWKRRIFLKLTGFTVEREFFFFLNYY